MPKRDVSVILMFHRPHECVCVHARASDSECYKVELNVSRAEEVST